MLELYYSYRSTFSNRIISKLQVCRNFFVFSLCYGGNYFFANNLYDIIQFYFFPSPLTLKF